MQYRYRQGKALLFLLLLVSPLWVGRRAYPQTSPDSEKQLLQTLEQLRQELNATRQELSTYRSKMEDLQQKVDNLQQQLNRSAATASANDSVEKIRDAVQVLKEEQEAQQQEIAVHDQVKVGSASQFPLRISGMVLFNMNSIDGRVDSTGLPLIAQPRVQGASNGSLTGTMSQTFLTLEGKGPNLWGASSYGSVQMDFYGNNSSTSYGSSSGVARLRTGSVELNWSKDKVLAGVAPLILTAKDPNTYVSVAEPGMSWSGNLWAWLPEVTVEHQFSLGADRKIALSGALMDVPDYPLTLDSSGVSSAERSRYPGTALHSSFQWKHGGPNAIGVGAYWSPHTYGKYGDLNAQAITVDWDFSLPRHLVFSGQFYNGAALGGLHAGAYKDYIIVPGKSNDGYGNMYYQGLRDQGGWGQLAWAPSERLSFNAAYGQDGAPRRQLLYSKAALTVYSQGLLRNQTWFTNVIYRPHSSLFVSAEFRRINTWYLMTGKDQAQIFALAGGYRF